MLIVVRILQGFGLGMLLALVPLYLAEVSPPQWRGVLTGLTSLSFGLGYAIYALDDQTRRLNPNALVPAVGGYLLVVIMRKAWPWPGVYRSRLPVFHR